MTAYVQMTMRLGLHASKIGGETVPQLRSPTAVEPAPAVPPQPDTQKKESPQALTLKDIKVGNKDGRGFEITRIYAVQSDECAIYQAGEVMVHFADDQGKAQTQRKGMLPVSSARAEVNALVQGLPCREICDRQLAYALQLALDGD